MLPLFYERRRGFDYALYSLVLEQARFFQVERLRGWIEEERYLGVVKTTWGAAVVNDGAGVGSVGKTTRADVEIGYQANWIRKVYVCPRGIYVHRGNQGACGKACIAAQGDAEVEYEDEDDVKVLEVRRQTVCDNGCLKEEQE